jgi:VanZ family protein
MKKILLDKSSPLALGWTLLIFVLCCTPGKFIPHSNWLELLSFDKFVHASIFFILCILWNYVLLKKQKNNLLFKLIILVSCISYGGILELMQTFYFSGRSGDWYDFIANTFGVTIAWFVFQKNNKLQNL